ncbi:MAG: glutathionylspermidine synthase family protein [Aliivibrio sp.]|uniref:glutathionylspermidine synthase family protein n=1 Tax=Aliivibrio sp. TaxID=1872443 RepID=UPI001A5E46B9|nr:glutathionylspermidine synthase family protein [Aliivibrio sp.]
MLRIESKPRPNWQRRAAEFGFGFHTMYGEPYWDESAYYQFTLKQIEQDLEDPTQEIHEMCLDVVDKVVRDEELLRKFQIPQAHRQGIADSWKRKEPSLYSRLDLAYDGSGPAKFYENNADTPTSVFETGFWQWLWLEDKVKSGHLRRDSDQFNLLQELLMNRFKELQQLQPGQTLHFSCCHDTEEDRGTVQYMEDCAKEAGLSTAFVHIEDIGVTKEGEFTDADDKIIRWMFKLYPWEFMFDEEFGQHLPTANVNWLEPMWKAVISNKALLPTLWKMFPNHPNLLPSFFSGDPAANVLKDYVVKPLFSREGSNIQLFRNGKETLKIDGPYGEEGSIIQAFHPLPKFGDNYTLIGSWLINDQPAGISIREDSSLITQDLSRYLPHIIID